uniref:Uncharacterized protein n=1 Tax=Arundo donax TaxID=35708 RepID=A0A0A8XNW6_ARUDO
MRYWHIEMKHYAHLPCLNVGKSKGPNYLPIELCHLALLQRYAKALTVLQHSSVVDKSQQNPSQRKLALSGALRGSNYNCDDKPKKVWHFNSLRIFSS